LHELPRGGIEGRKAPIVACATRYALRARYACSNGGKRDMFCVRKTRYTAPCAARINRKTGVRLGARLFFG